MVKYFAPGPLVFILSLVLCPTVNPCQYTLMEIRNKTVAHVVNINGSDDQTYRIRIMDKHNEIRDEKISNQTSFEIPFEWLKPCTEYTVSVDDCNTSGRNTFTSSNKGGTVHKTVVTSVTDNEVCLKGEFTDIQWNLTECVELTENSSCSSTHTVKLDTCDYTMNVVLPPVKPKIRFNTTIPSRFEWTNKPEKCSDTLNITCNNDRRNIYVLNDSVTLLPNKLYTCTGEYPYEKQPIKSHEHSFKITCNLTQNAKFTQVLSESFSISWKPPLNDNCSKLNWEDYKTSCTPAPTPTKSSSCTKDQGNDTKCDIKGLTPYTEYICRLSATFLNQPYVIGYFKNKTNATNPVFKKGFGLENPSHNSIRITCNSLVTEWNGGEGTYKAEIQYNGQTLHTKENKDCSFIFENLHYLTTYNIKVSAINSEKLVTFHDTQATTKYNDKAVVGFLVFLAVVTSIALVYVFIKMHFFRRKRDEEDGEDEDCVAQDIYVNVPMRVHRTEKKQKTSGGI